LIDPLNGGRDLQKRILRACSSSSFQDDPVRLMRAIRFSIDLGLGIDPVTLIAIKKAAPLLSSVSHERIRDELFRILEGSQPSVGLRLLDTLFSRTKFPETMPFHMLRGECPSVLISS